MQKAKVYDISGKVAGEINLPACFDTEIKEELLHDVAKAQLANSRKAIANTKTRGEISGGGKKPWRQKGTGRARAGSSRSPLWRGGGITFGPSSDRNFSQKINKKVAKLALMMAYSVKAKDKNLYILDSAKFSEPKTKHAFSLLKQIEITGKSNLIAISEEEEVSRLAFRNISRVFCKNPVSISVTDLLKFKNLVVSKAALSSLEDLFASKTEKVEDKAEKKPVKVEKKTSVVEKLDDIKKTEKPAKTVKKIADKAEKTVKKETKTTKKATK